MSKLKIGTVEVEMISNPDGQCIQFGKARCISSKYGKIQKELTKEKRCNGDDKACKGFIGQSAFVPEYDENYLLPPLESQIVATALAGGDNILLSGPPGTGKTSLVKQLAAVLNWGVIQFSCSEETSSARILGQWVVAGKTMKFSDGTITTAMKKGFILLEDEADFMRPELRGELHSLMEHKGTVTLSAMHPVTNEPYQEVITKHPNFRWVSTANTTGYGDDGFQFAGTQYLNSAARDRYEIIAVFKNKPPEIEAEIVKQKTGIEISIAMKMVEIANLCRDEGNNDVTFQFSLRRLISWGRYWRTMGAELSTVLSVLNFASQNDRHFVKSLVRTHLGIDIPQ